MNVSPLLVGLLAAALCYLSLVETATRGSAAAVVLYRRRAFATAFVAGAGGAGLAALVQAIG
jgi:hypothetical protein